MVHDAKMVAALALVAALASTAPAVASVAHASQSLAADTQAEGILRRMQFDRKLLVCNAYPSTEALDVRMDVETARDGAHLRQRKAQDKSLTESTGGGLRFKECRNLGSVLKGGDRLSFLPEGRSALAGGAFKIGEELPEEDTVLLLVIERAPGRSHQLHFQSFAFPAGGDPQGSHLAVIDTFHHTKKHAAGEAGLAASVDQPRVVLSDVTEKASHDSRALTQRTETLLFNRVYEVDSGAYHLSFPHADVASTRSNKTTTHAETDKIRLRKGEDYVILRVGSDELDGGHPELVVYPHESGAMGAASVGLAALCSVFAARFL